MPWNIVLVKRQYLSLPRIASSELADERFWLDLFSPKDGIMNALSSLKKVEGEGRSDEDLRDVASCSAEVA